MANTAPPMIKAIPKDSSHQPLGLVRACFIGREKIAAIITVIPAITAPTIIALADFAARDSHNDNLMVVCFICGEFTLTKAGVKLWLHFSRVMGA